MNKKFVIKIYDKAGTYITTLKPSVVKSIPAFQSQINGGFGQCVLDLNLPFDDFGEGSTIAFMNIVKIYVMDENYPLGRLVYTGFISAYAPYLDDSRQGVKITLLGLVSILSLAYYKNGSNFTVAASGDPSVLMKNIINHFNSVYPGSLLGYNGSGTTVDTVGVSVSYTFNEDKWLDALQNAFGTVGAGWWWAIDKQGQLYLKQKPATATHIFSIGKEIESLEVDKTSEKIVNKVRVKYGTSSTFDDDDATSITKFGTREEIVSDSKIQNLATATQRAAKEVDDNKVEKIKAKLVINSSYDLESIKVGDTCKIRNLSINQAVFNDNMMIVSVTYSFNKVTIELEEMTKFSTELQKFIS